MNTETVTNEFQNNENRFVNFIKRHRILFIGIAVYIIFYILNNIFPPWILMDYEWLNQRSEWVIGFEKENASGGFLDAYIPDFLRQNRFIEIIPLDILYYGFADIAAAFHYGIYIPLAFITYIMLMLNKFLEKAYMLIDYYPRGAERILNSYLYSNMLFYPLSFVMIYTQKLLEYFFIDNEFFEMLPTFDGVPKPLLIIIFIIIVLLIISLIIGFVLFLVFPMFINALFFFAYISIVNICADFIDYVNNMLFCKIPYEIVGELLAFLFAVIVLLAMNILLESLLEKIWHISLKPTLFIIHKIGNIRRRRT